MFRDQKNINIKVFSWLLLAIFVPNMHHLCTFIYLDVLHLNYFLDLSVLSIDKRLFIKDVFVFYDAPANVKLDIQYYVYFVGQHIKSCIVAYLLYSAIVALNTLMDTATPFTHPKPRLNFYRRIKAIAKVYLFIQLYYLFTYVLCAGQFLKGVPLFVFSVLVGAIVFIHKKENGWQIKAEL